MVCKGAEVRGLFIFSKMKWCIFIVVLGKKGKKKKKLVLKTFRGVQVACVWLGETVEGNFCYLN